MAKPELTDVIPDLFFGEPASYWFELKQQAQNLNVDALIHRLAKLSAKVHFYEQHIKELKQFQEGSDRL